MSETTTPNAPTSETAIPNSPAQTPNQAETVPNFKGTKHKLNIYGAEQELDYDEVIARAQKASAADERFRKASEMEKRLADLIESVKSGDHKALVRAFGKDAARKVAEDILKEEIEWASLSEAERRAIVAEQERDEIKTKYERDQESVRKQKMEAIENKVAQEVDMEIAEVLKSMKAKPTPRIIARIAEQMLAHHQATKQHLSAKDAWSRVQRDLQQEIEDYLPLLEPTDARQRLPGEWLDRLRKSFVDDVTTLKPSRSTTQSDSQSSKKNRRMATEDFFKKLDDKFSK